MRTAYALYKGNGRDKLLNIDLSSDDLWFSAWVAENADLHAMPIKISDAHKAELRAAGYQVRKIEFQRVIEK